MNNYKQFLKEQKEDKEVKEHDVVYLNKNLGDLKSGTKGCIVHVGTSGDMYEVEFFDGDNKTISVETVSGSYLRK